MRTGDTYRVPDLKFNLESINWNHAGAKLNPDGQIVHGLKPLVCELEQKTRLAHT